MFFSRKSVGKFQVSLKSDKNILHEDRNTFSVISRAIILRVRNVSGKSGRKIKTYTSCLIFCFRENRAVYVITWKNIVEPGWPQMTIWRMSLVSWIIKATNTQSEYAILTAFPVQQWLHERATVLRYTYIAYRVYSAPRMSTCVTPN